MKEKIEEKKVKKETKQKKQVRYVARGRIYLTATFNNTLVTVADEKGIALCWGSCGKQGFSGTRKSTPFAATSAIEAVLKIAREKHGLSEAAVYIKGAGPGRDALLRVLRSSDIEISKLVDMTPIPRQDTSKNGGEFNTKTYE